LARKPRPKGLSLADRAPRYACAIEGNCWLVASRLPGLRVLDRSSVKIHGSCDDRTSLYPAAPFRLANMLHAWTRRARGDGAHLLNGRFHKAKSATPWCSHTSDPPNTPEGASEPLILFLAIEVTDW